MELKTIRLDQEPGQAVATIWLARPDRLNAWTGRMHTELRWVMSRLDQDDHTRVVIVTGDGRGFCAGADTKALESHVDRGGYDAGTPPDLANPGFGVRPELDADFAWMFGLEVVTIAAVNGPAAGVGLVLACYADLMIVAEDAKLTTAHGRINLPAEYGLSWLLPRIVGLTRANDLLLSSRIFSGAEAAAMGLANEALPAAQVLPRAREYAEMLVRTVSPASLATTKRQIAIDQLHDDPGASVRHAQALLDAMSTQPDYLEAVRVFGTGQTPKWAQRPRPTTA